MRENINNIPHTCHYCQYRHSGCPLDGEWDYLDNCPLFEPGRCFLCDVFKANGYEHAEYGCEATNAWDYCGNDLCFKGDIKRHQDRSITRTAIARTADDYHHIENQNKARRKRKLNKRFKALEVEKAKNPYKRYYGAYRLVSSKPVYVIKDVEIPEHTVSRLKGPGEVINEDGKCRLEALFEQVTVPARTVKRRVLIDKHEIEPYAVRCEHRNKYKRYLKSQSHKKVRRSKGLYNGWSEHKLYDYWWELY